VIPRKVQSKNQKGRDRLEDVGQDNIKVNFIEMGCEGVDWINLAQDQCRVFVYSVFFIILDCEAIGIAATPGLLCQPRVIVKMIVEKQKECRLAGETEVLGEENLP
jgi:hypothetical protein